MYSKLVLIGLIVPWLLFAGPIIQVDQETASVGHIVEGEKDAVTHTFVIKNSGDEPLKISGVRASCGCTVVDYDSIIAPGKTGNLVQKINMDGISHGPFAKSVTVSSNATNNKTLRLTLGGEVQSILIVTPKYLRMIASEDNRINQTLTLQTKADDLKVKDVTFTPYGAARSTTPNAFSENLPYAFTASLEKNGEADEKGYFSYTLDISTPYESEKTISGYLILQTNLEKKKEVKLTSSLVPHRG